MANHLPKQIDEGTNRHHHYENWWKEVSLELLARNVALEGLSLLDYGCGRGETLSLATRMGMQAEGVDLDEECVAISREHGTTSLLTEPDSPVRQFGAKSFDVVTCFHVLEHVNRPKEVLTDLGRIARRFVLVAVPNLRSLPRPRSMRREPRPVNEGHLQGWDHAHFRNLVEQHCNLRVIGWGFDHCKVPLLSGLVGGIAGEKALCRLEAGLFCRLFPFHSASVIALLAPVD